ncbi:MAG: hypothetical protein AAF078_01925 [Planctomycetota bacterium]
MAVYDYVFIPAMNQVTAWRDAATSPVSQSVWSIALIVVPLVIFVAALVGVMKAYVWASSGAALQPLRERIKRLVESEFQTVDIDES